MDKDAGLSAGERAMLLIEQQMELCVTPEQLEDLWSRAEGPMRSYINQQADYIKNRAPHNTGDGMLGTWLEATSQNASPPAASLLLDAVMSRFDAQVQYTPDQNQFGRGLQQTVDRAPHRAGDVSRWIVTDFKRDAQEGGIVPLTSLVKPRSDGDGLILGTAIIERMKLDGIDGRTIENMERIYGDAKGEAEIGLGQQVQRNQLDLMGKNMPEVVQAMFDDLLGTTGNIFTTKHNLAGMTDTQQDNLIGRGLYLPPDNPNAGPNEPLYTDPAKLDQIHKARSGSTKSAARHRSFPLCPPLRIGEGWHSPDDHSHSRRERPEWRRDHHARRHSRRARRARQARRGQVNRRLGRDAGAGRRWYRHCLGLFRTAETAGEMASHGQSFNPIAFGADGAWLGFIDPAAGGLWLGFIASGTGMAALKPLALMRSLGNLGKGATAETAALLRGAGMSKQAIASLSRNVRTDLFLRRGAQTAIYRAHFAPGQMGRAGMINARTAQLSGGALMTTQAAGLIDAAQAGQLDLTDLSLFPRLHGGRLSPNGRGEGHSRWSAACLMTRVGGPSTGWSEISPACTEFRRSRSRTLTA